MNKRQCTLTSSRFVSELLSSRGPLEMLPDLKKVKLRFHKDEHAFRILMQDRKVNGQDFQFIHVGCFSFDRSYSGPAITGLSSVEAKVKVKIEAEYVVCSETWAFVATMPPLSDAFLHDIERDIRSHEAILPQRVVDQMLIQSRAAELVKAACNRHAASDGKEGKTTWAALFAEGKTSVAELEETTVRLLTWV